MIKKIVIWLGKKVLIKSINELLAKNQDKVLKITATITTWTSKLQLIIEALNALNQRVVDGELTKDELKESIDDVSELVRKF